MPNIGDIIELIVDIPKRDLRTGMQGTIVHSYQLNPKKGGLKPPKGGTLNVLLPSNIVKI